MPADKLLSGMQGVYLVAAQLVKRGYVASVTSRNTAGADILVTDRECQRAYAVQVKTNKKTFDFWLAGNVKNVSPCYIYVLVNIRNGKNGEQVEYYVVPSRFAAEHLQCDAKGNWPSICLKDVKQYKDDWSVFERP